MLCQYVTIYRENKCKRAGRAIERKKITTRETHNQNSDDDIIINIIFIAHILDIGVIV